MANNPLGARQDSSFKAVSTAPSINKTPAGSAMVPLPYPTTQDLSNSVSVVSSVKFNGDPCYTLDHSTQPSCKGDNPGTGTGVKSGTVNGEVKPTKASSTVRAGGNKVVRQNDPNTMNGGNNPGIYLTAPAPAPGVPRNAASTSQPAPTKQEQSWLQKTAQYYKDNISQSAHDVAGKSMEYGGAAVLGGEATAAAGAVATGTVVFAEAGVPMMAGGAVVATGGEIAVGAGSVTETAATGMDNAADYVLSGKMPDIKAAAIGLAQNLVINRLAKYIPGLRGEANAAKAEAKAEVKAEQNALKEKEKEAEKLAKKKPAEPEPAGDGVGVKGNKKGGGKPCKSGPTAGKPVNPVFGCKVLEGPEDLDFDLPGLLPLPWQRSYNSDNPTTGWLGQGWSIPLSLALEVSGQHVVVLDAQHRGITFDLPQVGKSQYSPFEQITLKRTEADLFELIDSDGGSMEFMRPSADAKIAFLIRINDRNGNRVNIRYTAELQPCNITDSAGRNLSLQFNRQQRLTGVLELIGEPDKNGRYRPDQIVPLVYYEYDAAGDLVRVRDRNGETTREFAYRNHMLVMHSQPGGVVSEYDYTEYTPKGKVTRNWTNTGQTWNFHYGLRETAVVDHLGRNTHYLFDDEQRFIGQVDAEGGMTRRILDDYGNLTELIDAAGRKTTYRYDKRSRVTSMKAPDGAVTDVAYDARFDQPAAITGANGATTRMQYDERGNLIAVTDALKQSTRYAYNAQGLPETITDARGGVKRLTYNIAGQLTSYTDCSQRVTRFEYDSTGNLIRSVDPLGQSTQYQYDRNGRLLAVRHPDDSHEYYKYDSLGRLVAYTDPAGERTTYRLDLDGQPLARTNALGASLQYRYDAARRLAQLVNENGAIYAFNYDGLDRLTAETGFDGSVTRYRYDATGLPIGKEELGDDGGKSKIDTAYVRDPAGRLVEKIVARAGKVSGKPLLPVLYGLDGKPTTPPVPNVNERQRTRYSYNKLGQLIAARNAEARVELEYDDIGQLIAETTINHGIVSKLKHAYDELGNRVQTTLPDGRVVNQMYYGSGHLHQINIDGEVVSDIERDQAHREIGRTQGVLSSRYGYDPMGRLRAQVAQLTQPTASQPTNRGSWEALGDLPTAQEANGRVVARRYDYDKSGKLTSILDKRFGATNYRYDALGRILSATNRAQTGVMTAETFAFDPAHNMLDVPNASNASGNNQPATNKQPLTDNRLTVFEDKRYAYDAHGNLIDKKIGKHTQIKLEWDAEHQLRASHVSRNAQQHYRPIEQTTHYGYDPFGRRLFKRDAFGVTRFVWDGNRLLSETRGSKSRTYLYEPGSFVPLAQVDGNEMASAQDGKPSQEKAELLYFHNDHIGTPRELTDAQGNLRWTATYTTWGNVLRIETHRLQSVRGAMLVPQTNAEVEEITQPLRFQGQYFDSETGLHYNRFRYYDPDCGRFVSQDPIGLAGGENSYQYTRNPVNWIDPLGLVALRSFDPPKGMLSNKEVRCWYKEQEAKISSQIDPTQSLKQQARQAHQLRNEARIRARLLMEDRQAATGLYSGINSPTGKAEPMLTWKGLTAKLRGKGLDGDDLWREIIGSSQKSRASVDASAIGSDDCSEVLSKMKCRLKL